MNRYSSVVFFVVVVLALAMAGPPARAVGLSFGQIDWEDGNGGFVSQNSDWGQVTVSFSSFDAGLLTPDGMGGYFGFMNVITTVGGGHSMKVHVTAGGGTPAQQFHAPRSCTHQAPGPPGQPIGQVGMASTKYAQVPSLLPP